MRYLPPPVSNEKIDVTQVGTIVGDTPVYIYADVLDELKYSAAQRTARGMLTGFHRVKGPTIKYISLKPRAAQTATNPDIPDRARENPIPPAQKSQNTGSDGNGIPDDVARQNLSAEMRQTPDIVPSGDDNPHKNDPEYVLVTAFKDMYPAQDAMEYATYLRRQRNFRSENEEQAVVGMVTVSAVPWSLMLEDLMLQRTYCASEWQIALFVDANYAHPRVFILTQDLAQFTETGYFEKKKKNGDIAL